MSILALVWLWKRKYFGTLLCGLVTEIANLFWTMYIDIDTNGDFTTYAGFGITALLITRIVIPVLLAVLLIVYMKVNNLSLRYYIYKIQNLKYRINDASVIHIKEKQVEYFSHTVYTKIEVNVCRLLMVRDKKGHGFVPRPLLLVLFYKFHSQFLTISRSSPYSEI